MPKLAVGATIRANNSTHGLAPAREMGPDEIVTKIEPYDLSVWTDAGNYHLGGTYTIMRNVSACCGESFSRPPRPHVGPWTCDNCHKPCP